jgi:hypothetical protein
MAVLLKIQVSWQYTCPKCNYLPCDTVCIPEDLNLDDDISISDCDKILAFLPSIRSQVLEQVGSMDCFSYAFFFLFTSDKVGSVYVSNTMPHQGLGST